jgi:hypothetical protein
VKRKPKFRVGQLVWCMRCEAQCRVVVTGMDGEGKRTYFVYSEARCGHHWAVTRSLRIRKPSKTKRERGE